MRRGRSNRLPLILLILLVVVALFGGLFFVLSGSSGGGSAQTPQATISGTNLTPGESIPTATPAMSKIVIAARDLSVGTTLKEDLLTLADVPSSDVDKTDSVLAKDVGFLYGKLNSIRLFKGQRIHRNDVIEGPFSNLMAKLVKDQRLEPGKKAMAFAADDLQSVGQLISDGDLVDLVATYILYPPSDPPYILSVGGTPVLVQPSPPAPEFTTKTILQNVRVLKTIQLLPAFELAGDTPVPPTAPPGSVTPVAANAPAASGTVTNVQYLSNGQGFPISTILILGVTDQEAEVIKFTREQQYSFGSGSGSGGGSGSGLAGSRAVPGVPPVIHFVLRSRPTTANNPNDASLLREETRGSTFRIMVTNYGVQVPEIIRVK